MAPARAANRRWAVTNPGDVLIRPPPTVFATFVELNAPTKFMMAAISTASRGDSARVETDVATALAVSWNPFVKSKPSATTTTTQSKIEFTALAVLDENRLEHVSRVFKRVDGVLEPLVDVLPPNDHDRVLDVV